MLSRIKRPLIAATATCALALGASAGPASAATQNGLVNVDLTGNTVQVPVAVAATICGVQANVIATDNFGGNALCTSTSRSTANGGGGGGGGNTDQSGLVNVAITNNTVQIPIGIAADVCGVQANVLAAGNFGGNAVCTAVTRPNAQA
jgi:hypothetical protein